MPAPLWAEEPRSRGHPCPSCPRRRGGSDPCICARETKAQGWRDQPSLRTVGSRKRSLLGQAGLCAPPPLRSPGHPRRHPLTGRQQRGPSLTHS